LGAREVLRGVLTKQGYNLAFATNGQEALAQAAELIPDLILLDVMMPDMTGIEVCSRLRADPVLAEVPVIMVTALDDSDSLLQSLKAGADDFLSKPFNHAELQARVHTITRLNRYRRLLSERTKFDWVVKHAQDGYVIIDEQDNIGYANAQGRLYLGLPAENNEPFLATFLQLATSRYQLRPEEAWTNWPRASQSAGAEPVARYLVQPETDTANAFWLQVEALALPTGTDPGWLVHLQDVTTQMDLQRIMWEFQSFVSHKLRTPLSSVVTGLYLLESDNVADLLKPELANVFNLVVHSSERLETSIQSILHHIISPNLVQAGEGFPLAEFEDLATRLSTEVGLDTVAVSLHPTLTPKRIPLSRDVMDLIVSEILENARKFHPNHAPRVEIILSPLNDNRQISLQFSDDGLTLSPEQLSQVWQPYYQGEKYFTGEAVGMGLGLTKVTTLIWNVGGTCRLSNRETGSGVRVELVLPLEQND
jgi:CheY-like chemotaxis protein